MAQSSDVNLLMTRSISPNDLLIRRLQSIHTVSKEEIRALRDLPLEIASLGPGHDIVRMGERPTQCCVVIEGFTCIYKLTSDGGRQIMAIHVPGDIPDIQSLHLGVMDFGLAPISSCTVGYIPHEKIQQVCDNYPRLGVALWRETLIDAAIYRDWMLNIGQCEAFGRVAHLVCELVIRLKAVGLTEGDSFKFPVTQANLADAFGISSVHMSRVYGMLAQQGLLKVTRTHVTVLDWDELQEAGDFDPTYLHLERNTPA
ncbi:Crp/Fnr family transcriptional regulator [Salinicola acroporae]|uniref:Crp/Fnr family transcriptional regulator n=1 Tax=Salinicola acroporae TaxID=1541440 RepID=UPI001F0B7A47|nr:Crp/Fnr family transcriptional regulator [Salinicola acroporae]